MSKADVNIVNCLANNLRGWQERRDHIIAGVTEAEQSLHDFLIDKARSHGLDPDKVKFDFKTGSFIDLGVEPVLTTEPTK